MVKSLAAVERRDSSEVACFEAASGTIGPKFLSFLKLGMSIAQAPKLCERGYGSGHKAYVGDRCWGGRHLLKASSIVWRRTFPDAAPGTDGVAIFEGRVIRRVQHMTNPRWSWSVTDPTLAGLPAWANTNGEMPSRRQAMARLIERWEELRRSA